MWRGNNPPLSATSVYPSESDKYMGKDEVGSYSCVRNGVAGKQQAREWTGVRRCEIIVSIDRLKQF